MIVAEKAHLLGHDKEEIERERKSRKELRGEEGVDCKSVALVVTGEKEMEADRGKRKEKRA